MKNIKHWWKNLLIKKKIIIGMSASLIGIITAVIISFWLFYSYLNVFSQILEEYSDNQSLNSAFGKVQDTLKDHVTDPDSRENETMYKNACTQMDRYLKKLPTDYSKIGRERYLKTMSVIHGYEGYQEQCNTVLTMSQEEENFLDELYRCYSIADYEQVYIDRLIDVTLESGIDLYHKQNTQIQSLPYIWLLLVCFLLLCLYLFGRSSISLEDLRQKIAHEKELNEIQMQLLQSQINPHFLFNTLNLISGMARIEDAKNTTDMTQRLSNIFRYNLKSQESTTSLFGEINIAKDYFHIQQRRFGKRIQLDWDIRTDPSEILIPAFTLQPLLENCVIHGISPKEEGGMMRIRIFRKNGWNHLSVIDNGMGIPPEKLKELRRNDYQRDNSSGIGITNVRSRFRTIYPQSIFRISSKYGVGTIITIIWKNQE